MIFAPVIYVALMLYVWIAYSAGIESRSMQEVSTVICAGMALDLFTGNKSYFKSMINGKNIILVGVIFWILLDGVLEGEGFDGYSPDAVLTVYMLILLFLLTNTISRLLAWPKWSLMLLKPIDRGDYVDPKKVHGLILFCFALGFMPLIIWGGGFDRVMWALTHAGRWNALWGRARWGDSSDYLKTILGYFLIMGLQLSWLYIVQLKKYFSPSVLFGSGLALMMVFITGTRPYLIGALAPLALLYFFKSKCEGKKRMWVVVTFGVLMLSLAQLQLQVRDADSEETIWSIAQHSFVDIVKQNPTDHDRDYELTQLFSYADLIPRQIPFSGEMVALRPIYHFVPRFLWKGKPEGIARFIETEMNDDSNMTTFAGSIIGDFYICQGWIGVALAGILMGFLVKQLDYLTVAVRRSPAILFIYSYGLMFMFTSIRSYQVIYEGWFIFILFYFVLKNTQTKRLNPIAA